MGRIGRRTFANLVAAVWLVGCAGATTQPSYTDVDRARAAWLNEAATSYSFELATTSSWSPKGAYVRVQVNGGRVVTAVAPDDVAQPVVSQPTIDDIWDRILAARASGQLNSAEFDIHGVPIESDMGPWPVDGGVHYSVRGFTRVR